MSREISEITRDITLQNEQLEADQRGLAHIVEQIAAVGDAAQTIQDWRVQMARLGRPSVLVPKHMLENQRALEAHNATKAALEASISDRQGKIAALEQALEQAQEQAFKGTWNTVCEQARAICKDLEAARVAYLDASKKLYALHQTAKPGEFFPPDVVSHYAPDFKNTLKRPYDIATGLDMTTWKRELGPIREQAIAWRQSLVTQPDAPYPA